MYFLEVKRRYSMPNVLGNCSQPVDTWRWVQIAVCEEKEPLENLVPQIHEAKNYFRIISNEVKQ